MRLGDPHVFGRCGGLQLNIPRRAGRTDGPRRPRDGEDEMPKRQ